MSRQLEILQHSLGVDQYGRGRQYRNYYVASAGHHSWTELLALVAAGLMGLRPGNAISGGGDVFFVTPAGRDYVAAHSPKPPKLTASQRRYRAFLAEDSGLLFGEWLKASRA